MGQKKKKEQKVKVKLFTNLAKKSTLQFSEAQQTLSRKNTKKITPRHIRQTAENQRR